MIRKLVTGGVMAFTAVAMASAALAPSQVVLAAGICAGGSVTGSPNANLGPLCVPYNDGVNCQTFSAGGPTFDATVYECVPRP